MPNNKIPKYFKEYLDERFDRLEKDIAELKINTKTYLITPEAQLVSYQVVA